MFDQLATLNNVFTFSNKLCNQVDGVAMGSPLGPVFADIFMNFTEKSWLDKCPIEFKPLYYRSYVDDTLGYQYSLFKIFLIVSIETLNSLVILKVAPSYHF